MEEPVENGLECEKVAVVSTKAEEELEKKQKEEMGNECGALQAAL